MYSPARSAMQRRKPFIAAAFLPSRLLLAIDDAVAPRADELAGGGNGNGRRSASDSLFWLNVGAAVTQESCPLLGVKSLGVDYGLVRTGLAVTVGFEPTPLAILSGLNATETCAAVVQHAASHQVQRVIVGLPLHKNGTVAEQTVLTLDFARQLAVAVLSRFGPDLPVLLFDERYTSKEAAARAHSRHPYTALYGTLDALAACIILENYYEDAGVGAHPVPLPAAVRRRGLALCAERALLLDTQRRAAVSETGAKMARRKEAIARARRLDDEERASDSGNGDGNDDDDAVKKRKRKKKKKK